MWLDCLNFNECQINILNCINKIQLHVHLSKGIPKRYVIVTSLSWNIITHDWWNTSSLIGWYPTIQKKSYIHLHMTYKSGVYSLLVMWRQMRIVDSPEAQRAKGVSTGGGDGVPPPRKKLGDFMITKLTVML